MSLFGPIVKLTRALKERGLKGTITQLYLVSFINLTWAIWADNPQSRICNQIGDLKFGELKGTDKFGNKYYEVNINTTEYLIMHPFAYYALH